MFLEIVLIGRGSIEFLEPSLFETGHINKGEILLSNNKGFLKWDFTELQWYGVSGVFERTAQNIKANINQSSFAAEFTKVDIIGLSHA